MTAQSKVYLITGSNRGIGLSIVKNLSERPQTTVIATARNPDNAVELNEWIKTHPNVHVFKYDAAIKEDAYSLAHQVSKITDGIDVLVANAAVAEGFYKIIDVPDEKWSQHFHTNALGPVFLFKAFYEQLKQRDTRQVIFISSNGGSLTGFIPLSLSAYGASKAHLNYSMKEISFETKSEGFTVISLHPGVVNSDMGNEAKVELLKIDPNVEEFFNLYTITPEESAKAQIKVIDNLTKDDTGKFFAYDGEETPF